MRRTSVVRLLFGHRPTNGREPGKAPTGPAAVSPRLQAARSSVLPNPTHDYDRTDLQPRHPDRFGKRGGISPALVPSPGPCPACAARSDLEKRIRTEIADELHKIRFDGGIGSVPDMYFWGVTHAERIVRGER